MLTPNPCAFRCCRSNRSRRTPPCRWRGRSSSISSAEAAAAGAAEEHQCVGDFQACADENGDCCSDGFVCVKQPGNEHHYCIADPNGCDLSSCSDIQGQGRGECEAQKSLECCQAEGTSTTACCDGIYVKFGYGIFMMTETCREDANGCDLGQCQTVHGQGLGECLGEARVKCCLDGEGKSVTQCCDENVDEGFQSMISFCRNIPEVSCAQYPQYESCADDESQCHWSCKGLHDQQRSIDCPFGSYPETGGCPGGHCYEMKYTCSGTRTVRCGVPPEKGLCEGGPKPTCSYECADDGSRLTCPTNLKPTMGPCPHGHCMKSEYFCGN
eukprot:TRINITY_DN13313_c0_g1_i2.p1 TRINITY_DN13313_c0_g1~~TRINITY_DN13313_c0_g1_i2.p1  ORF type:complete len:327 (-),score=63.35 TRINITY_DN13313_c0_g1_i2:66-1046(-)